MSRIEYRRRPDGGIEIRVQCTPEEHRQAERGLIAMHERDRAEREAAGLIPPRRQRRTTPATVPTPTPTMSELTADAWRRCVENAGKNRSE